MGYFSESSAFRVFIASICIEKAGQCSTVDSEFDSSHWTWVRYLVQPHAFVPPSIVSRRAIVCYWQKHVHLVLVNCLGGLLPAQE